MNPLLEMLDRLTAHEYREKAKRDEAAEHAARVAATNAAYLQDLHDAYDK